MKGLKKRISAAFLSIAGLLFFAGMLSFFELSHLSRATDDILKANQHNIELAKQMLDAAHDQNRAFIRMSVYHEEHYDSLCRSGMERLEEALAKAQEEALDKSFLDSLAFTTIEMRLLTDRFLAHWEARRLEQERLRRQEQERALEQELERMLAMEQIESRPDAEVTEAVDSTLVVAPAITMADFAEQEQYDRLYSRLTTAIQSYMTSTQSSLAPRTEQMKKNAYRAVTPVLISLLVMIGMVLLLYYFVMLYCIDPVVNMNRSLGDLLKFDLPFRPKGNFQDELRELHERIEKLIAGRRPAADK